MDKIDLKLSQKERELEEYLSRVQDPQLRQLLSDINALRRAKELVSDTLVTSTPMASDNGHSSTAETLTQGDAVVEIIRKAGRPVHINTILEELVKEYGIRPKQKSSLVSNIRKDRQNRFVGKGAGFWALRSDVPSPRSTRKGGHSGNGKSPLYRAGFSLIGAIKDLIPQIQGEFSQPIIYKKLREMYPAVANKLQKASVATTLRKLESDGLIEVTHQGYGSDPRRYRRVK